MNKDDYLNKSTFLYPYYKQFIKLLNNNKIFMYDNKKIDDSEFFNNNNIEILDSESSELADGLILNNYLAAIPLSSLPIELKRITERLKEKGIILLINNKQIIDEDTIRYLFKENYDEVEELIGDDKWNFVLYQKKTTK